MAGKGGRRPGAGRPPGSRQKVTEKAIRRAGEGMTPLEYLLQVMRDDKEKRAVRLDAAKAAATYMHPRLSSVESKNETTVNFAVGSEAMTEDEWEQQYAHHLGTTARTSESTH